MAESTAQTRFDEKYISSREILRRLRVTRPTLVSARRRGLLPDAIVVNDKLLYLWEREKVEPFIRSWETILTVKRANKA